MTRKKQVRTVIFDTVKKQKGLSLGIVSAVIGAVVFALIPPLILADIVDSITAGTDAAFARILLYFAMLALTGFTESARESLLVVFGQKITHALRSSLIGQIYTPYRRQHDKTGARHARFPLCRRCRYR